MSNQNAIQSSVSIKKLKQALRVILDANLIAYIEGSPGVGKSDVVRAIAEERDLEVIDLRLSQCDPTDLVGLPYFTGEGDKRRASFTPLDLFPLEDAKPAKGKKGWIIFLDELPSAAPAVQAAAYRLLLDREVGQHKLHEKVWLIAAGNKITDGAIVNEMSSALQSRIVKLELEPQLDEWLDWASHERIDVFITTFLKWKADAFYTFDPSMPGKAYACPRTWAMASKLLANGLTKELSEVLHGTLGMATATEFFAYASVKDGLPDIQQILNNPSTTPVPRDLNLRWATIATLVSHTNKDTLDAIAEYVERFSQDFKFLFFRDVLRRYDELESHPIMVKWLDEMAQLLYGVNS